MRHQPQLNLRVIRRHQYISRSRNECRANLPADRSSDRNVLQVGIRTGETAGCSPNLIEGGVHATLRVGELWERVEIGRLELRELAVFEDESWHGMLLGEFFENVLCSGDNLALAVFHRLGKEHLVEQNIAKLFGRVDVETMTGVSVDALGEVIYL